MTKIDDAPQATLTLSTRSHRRLMLALALSAGIVGLIILLIPGPWKSADPDPSYAVEVRVLQPEQQVVRNAEPEVEPEPAKPAEQLVQDRPAATEEIASEEHSADDTAAPERIPFIDWYAALDRAAVGSAEQTEKTPSMSPQFDDRRRVARNRYRKSEAPVEMPIWENVDKDQMGRTILRAGDCYRVLDDPSVANQWAQENFTQFILFCGSGKPLPEELPFVADIVARYAYLQPDHTALITDVSD